MQFQFFLGDDHEVSVQVVLAPGEHHQDSSERPVLRTGEFAKWWRPKFIRMLSEKLCRADSAKPLEYLFPVMRRNADGVFVRNLFSGLVRNQVDDLASIHAAALAVYSRTQ